MNKEYIRNLGIVEIILILMAVVSVVSVSHAVNEEFTVEQQELPHVTFDTNESFNTTPETLDPMPMSEYLREYNMTKMGGIYRAINGSSYIDPDHEVVQWYARNTMFNESGLFYLNGEKVSHNHQSDFNYENGDYWLTEDYYLSQGFYGDCEDHAIAMASILEAKDISNMIVCISDRKGWNHVYVEYHYEREYHILNSIRPMYGVRTDDLYENYYKAWMFNKNNTYISYNENWMDIL